MKGKDGRSTYVVVCVIVKQSTRLLPCSACCLYELLNLIRSFSNKVRFLSDCVEAGRLSLEWELGNQGP